MFLSKLENTIFIRCKNLNRQETKVVLYWDSMKCPKKHAKDIFFTWWHMHIFCPIFEHFQFLPLFCSKSQHVSIFRVYKNGAIQKIYTWWDLERKIVRNWNYPNVRGISKFSSICHHVKNISFTCFLGHFMIPPVFQYDCWFLFNRIPFR